MSREASRLWTVGLGLAALAWGGCPSRPPAPQETVPPELTRLSAALSGRRLVAPRLSIESIHAPCGEADRVVCGDLPAPGDPRFPRLLEALAEFERRGDLAPRSAGLAALVESVGNPARIEAAILLLERASEVESDASVLADLAAAYLVRSEIRDDPLDLLRSTSAAHRAVERAPELPQARYNLALALMRLSIQRGAQESWDRFLEVEPDPSWKAEAAGLRGSLRPASPAPAATSARERRRTVFEETLPRWGELELAGRPVEAGRVLATARETAEDLASRGRFPEPSVLAMVHGIDRAPPAMRVRLARGLSAYGHGSRDYERRAQEEAGEAFARAAADLAGTPVAAWADVGRALASYQQGRYRPALEALDSAEVRLAEAPSPALAGRIWWIRGTIAVFEDRPAEAWAAYRRSADAFERAGEPESRLAVEARWVSALASLGHHLEAWRGRIGLLRQAGAFQDRREVQGLYGEAAHASLVSGHWAAALAFLEEAWPYLPPSGDPVSEIGLLRWRAQVHRGLGRPAAARNDLQEARRRLQAVQDLAHRSLVAAEVDVIAGELLVSEDPEGAVRALGAAIDRFEASGIDHLLPLAHLGRARAHRRLGELARASGDLEAAVAMIEARRAHGGTASERQALLADAREVYEEAVDLAIARADLDRAFSLTEALHARTLGDAVGAQNPLRGRALAPASRRVAGASSGIGEDFSVELASTLPAGVWVVSYLVLPDRLLRWTASREGVELATVKVPERRLKLQAEAFVSAVRGEDLGAVRAAGQELSEILVPEVSSTLLVFVPDGPLHEVPFDLLLDRSSGDFLIESVPVAVAPSAAMYQVILSRDRQRSAGAPRSALVVADPAFPRDAFPELPRLTNATAEGEAVAAIYPEVSLLVSEDATAERLLSEMGNHDVAHLAAHAVLNSADAGSSYLVLADGPFYARRLASSDLDSPRIVVLSSCSSGRSGEASGEGLSGLARALLESGASAVVGTLWPISDRIAASLSESLHRRLAAGAESAAALRAAKLERLAAGDPPATWAAFELIGGTAPMEEEK